MAETPKTTEQMAADADAIIAHLRPLHEHFTKIGAKCLREWPGPAGANGQPLSTFSLWTTSKRAYLLQVHSGLDGWEVWSPVVDTASVKATLAAIA
jgi:hypothetical protein